jgi:RNA polymerase sigma-70 factor (ECF subfamily)
MTRRRGAASELDPEMARVDGDPERLSSDREHRAVLQRALAELTPEYRAVVVLKHLQGLSYREIADLLGIDETLVKSRLFSARQRLRQVLEKRGVMG